MMGIRLAKGLGGLAFAVMALSACVSTPYVRINALQPAPPSGPPTLPASIQYAEAVQDLYRDKLIELGESERKLSTGLIALGGVMLGLGVGHAHHSVIEGVAIAGGTTYTAGVFSTDKHRSAVYGAGLEAMNCAVGAVSPLNLGSETLGDIKIWRGDSGSGRAEVMNAAARVAMRLDAMSKESAKKAAGAAAAGAARQSLTAASKALANSTDAAADGDRLLHRYEQSGGELRNAVKAIDTQVLNAVRALEVDVRAVPDALSRLMDNTRLFSNLATSAATASPSFVARAGVDETRMATEPDIDRLDAATFELQLKVAALEHQTQRLSRLVKAVSDGMQDNIRDCKVQLPFFVMSVSSNSVAFPTGVAGTQTIYVSGGQVVPTSAFAPTTTFIYTAEFVKSPHQGLTVAQDGRKVIIAATNETATGDYPLRVQDSTGGSVQMVMVAVGPPSGSPSALGDVKAKLDKLVGTDLSITNGVTVRLKAFNIVGGKLEVQYAKGAGAAKQSQVKDALLQIPELKGFGPVDLIATLVE